jgi:hypothetical protein
MQIHYALNRQFISCGLPTRQTKRLKQLRRHAKSKVDEEKPVTDESLSSKPDKAMKEDSALEGSSSVGLPKDRNNLSPCTWHANFLFNRKMRHHQSHARRGCVCRIYPTQLHRQNLHDCLLQRENLSATRNLAYYRCLISRSIAFTARNFKVLKSMTRPAGEFLQ